MGRSWGKSSSKVSGLFSTRVEAITIGLEAIANSVLCFIFRGFGSLRWVNSRSQSLSSNTAIVSAQVNKMKI